MKKCWVSFSLLLGAFAAGCGGSSGAITGKVLVDGAPLAGQQVVLQGAQTLTTAPTGTDGSFHFDDVEPATYILSVAIASTKEGRRQVVVKGPTTVPDLTFTGEGTVTGKVVDGDGNALAGVQVRMLGTSLAATTDASGAFTLEGAPTGTHTLSVSTPDGAGQATVKLALGKTQSVTIGLVATPPGTVTGAVRFSAPGLDLTQIQVSVPAAGVSTKAAVDGSFSLQLPPGEWDVVAQTTYFPVQKVGHVSVASGQSTALPSYELSIYTRLPEVGLEAVWSMPSTEALASRSAVVLEAEYRGGLVGDEQAYFAFQLGTNHLQLIDVGVVPVLSPDGTWAAIPKSDSVLIENLATSELFSVGTPSTPFNPAFSSDGSVLHFASGGQFFQVALADRTVTSLPDYSERDVGQDRVLVRTTTAAPNTWKLVTPSGVTTAFTNVTNLGSESTGRLGEFTVAYGVEDCASSPCPMDVLAGDATTAVGVTVAGAPFSTASLPSPRSQGSFGNWVTVTLSGGGQLLVDATTGQGVMLPTGSAVPTISPDGTRIIFDVPTPTGHAYYEQALPLPSGTSTPLLSSNGPLKGAWISGTRFVGFDESPTSGAPYRFSIDSGALTQDPDYQPASGSASSSGTAHWAAADGTIRFQAGNSPVFDAPPGETEAPSSLGADEIYDTSSQPSFVQYGDRAVAQWNDSEAFLFDGSAEPEPLAVFGGSGLEIINGFLLEPPGANLIVLNIGTGEAIPVVEPNLFVNGYDSSFEDGNTFLLQNGISSSGDPEGGYYALLPFFL